MPKLIYRDKEWEVPADITVREAIQQIGLAPEMVLAVRGRKLVPGETLLKADDVIKLMAVVAGG